MLDAGYLSIERVTLPEYELMQAFLHGRHEYDNSDAASDRRKADMVMGERSDFKEKWEGKKAGVSLIDFIEKRVNDE